MYYVKVQRSYYKYVDVSETEVEIWNLRAYTNYSIKVAAIVNYPTPNASIGISSESLFKRTRSKCIFIKFLRLYQYSISKVERNLYSASAASPYFL